MKVRGMAMDDKENATRGVVASKIVKSEQSHSWNSFNILNIGNVATMDERGGTPGVKCVQACSGSKENGQDCQQLPTSANNAYKNYDECMAESAVCAAYGIDDNGEAAAAVNFHSNRTSRNNSTENLSFCSDNFFPEELLFFQDDDDDANAPEADDISCESDDCVYAYRGDGTELYFPMDAAANIADNGLDDEMDFLEMDFEPDTLSEVENGGNSIESDIGTVAISEALHLSGRHSSSSHLKSTTDGCHVLPSVSVPQRQLFSSPIKDVIAVPVKSQTLLGKNFGRMSLHLDQINAPSESLENETAACEAVFDRVGCVDVDGSSSHSSTRRTSHIDCVDYPTSTAHSLPNTLNSFGREQKPQEQPAVTHQISPSKVTGAKPKRLSTFSTSSSTSSKNSSKSRTSLRSVIGTSLFNSSSFDERSVSCNEFRSANNNNNNNNNNNCTGVSDASSTTATSTNGISANPIDFNEESCLDCLEKEFLANTIGKALEPSNCPKCRRKRSFFRSAQQSRCRSGSPSFFSDAGHDSFYEMPQDYHMNCSNREWIENRYVSSHYVDIGSLSLLTKRQDSFDDCLPKITVPGSEYPRKQTIKCDKSSEQKLPMTNISTDNEVVALSTTDLNEETLVRTLEQLQIAYNAELLNLYFTRHHPTNIQTNLSSMSSNNNQTEKQFKDLKQFILQESRKNCNHNAIKRLIEAATNHQVEIQFKQNTNESETGFVNVSVASILHHWANNSDLTSLRDLDSRFKTANILGKIGNLIRQAQTKRSLPETIAIPQYYPSGFLIIRKKSKP